jgi:hypothetical protein
VKKYTLQEKGDIIGMQNMRQEEGSGWHIYRLHDLTLPITKKKIICNETNINYIKNYSKKI